MLSEFWTLLALLLRALLRVVLWVQVRSPEVARAVGQELHLIAVLAARMIFICNKPDVLLRVPLPSGSCRHRLH